MVAIKITPEEKNRFLLDFVSFLISFLALNVLENHDKNAIEIRCGKM